MLYCPFCTQLLAVQPPGGRLLAGLACTSAASDSKYFAHTALATHAGHHEIWDLFTSTNVGSVLLSVCVLPPVTDSAKLGGQQELKEAVSESESDATADAVQAAAGKMCLLRKRSS